LKKIIIVILVLVLVTGAVFVTRYLNNREDPPVRYEQMNMGEFVVNLRDDQRRFLRTQIIIEYVYCKETEATLNLQLPKAKDRIISVLRSKSAEDISEAASLDGLRNELRAELELVLGINQQIVDLWFVLLMIQ